MKYRSTLRLVPVGSARNPLSAAPPTG